jgi:hypothetical protein
MEFTEFEPVVFIDEEIGGHFMEEPDELVAYQRVFAALSVVALDEPTSKALIAGMLSTPYDPDQDEEPHDADEEE